MEGLKTARSYGHFLRSGGRRGLADGCPPGPRLVLTCSHVWRDTHEQPLHLLSLCPKHDNWPPSTSFPREPACCAPLDDTASPPRWSLLRKHSPIPVPERGPSSASRRGHPPCAIRRPCGMGSLLGPCWEMQSAGKFWSLLTINRPHPRVSQHLCPQLQT